MKKISIPGWILSAITILAALNPPAALAADWEFSSAVNYDTGKYGAKDSVDSVYIPFTLKRYYLDADLSVTVPFAWQSAKGLVTRVGGKPVRMAGPGATAVKSAQSGLGDILLRGAYTLKLDGPRSFDLGLAGRIKLPTADKRKGLGTGELDEGAGLEFAKELSPGWTLLADGYYTIIGDPSGLDYNNQVSVDLGFYRPLKKNLGLTVLYETQNSIVDGNPDPRSVSGTLSYGTPAGIQWALGATLGISDGSPGLGLGAGVNRRF